MDIMEALQRCAPWCSMDPEAWNFVLVYMDEQNAKIADLQGELDMLYEVQAGLDR